MPSSSSSAAQAARQQLAGKLRKLREAAGLSGVDFAKLAGWSSSANVSKVEMGVRPASAEYVRLWCRLCEASERQTEELLAEQRNVAGMWVTYQQLNQGGLKKAQESVREHYERAQLMRVYVTKAIPGLLQTEAYTAFALRSIRMEQGVEVDDVAEAVGERMDRQSVLHRQDARWVFILEEEVLWHRTIPREAHREQLQHLLAVMRLPSVSLGIIPRTAERFVHGYGVWPDESFLLTGNEIVNVELVSGYLSVTQPDEIGMYLRAWERLSALAVVGDQVVGLIRSALESLE